MRNRGPTDLWESPGPYRARSTGSRPRASRATPQSLLGGRESAGIQFVCAHRRHEILDLGARRGDPGLIGPLEHAGRHQRHEQPDDGHHHQHFDQGDASLCAPSVSFFAFEHIYTATSLMLVIASNMLKISAPTTMPITRMIMGSKSAVKRLMEARVSFS